MNRRLLVIPALAIAAAAAIWLPSRSAGGVPACTWRIVTGNDVRQGRPFDELPPETPLRLSVWCDEPRHVYVFSHSAEDGTILLWPSASMKTDLPKQLTAGTSVLPGKIADKELAWNTRAGIRAVTTFVVVAAKNPVPELEELLPKVRSWTNTVFGDESMQVTKPVGDYVGRAGAALPSALLARTAERDRGETLTNGPLRPDSVLADVWTGAWTCVERKN